MHATWPVYTQPEERNTTKDDMTLSVSPRNTCLGAENRQIVIQAVLTADVPLSLRLFKLALVHKLTYMNSGSNQPGRKGAVLVQPSIHSSVLSEDMRPVNVLLYHGMQESCELTCTLPPNHTTTTTVTTARLMENTYEAHVSVMQEYGEPISIIIPITVSPFFVAYSMDMMQ